MGPYKHEEPAAKPPFRMGDAWAWLGLFLAGYVGGQLIASIFEVLWAFISGHGSHLQHYLSLSVLPTGLLVTSEIGLWCGFGGAALMAVKLRGTGNFRSDMGIFFRPLDLPLGVVIGVASQFLVTLLYLPFIINNPRLSHQLGQPARHLGDGSHGLGLIGLGLVLLVGAPFFEEVLFRGVLLPSLRKLLGRFGPAVGTVGGIALTGIVFGLAHFEPLQFAGLAVFGMILALLADRFKRLGPNMVAHASFNAVAMVSLIAARGH